MSEFAGVDVVLWGLTFIVLTVGVTALIVMVIVRLVAPENRTHASPALSVLEERYARGEIDRQEFLEKRAVLEGRADPQGSV